VASWTFEQGDSNSGIANNRSIGVSNATNGNQNGGATSKYGQAGWIQGTGDFYQSVSGFSDGLASINFSLEARGGDAGLDPVDVLLDGVQIGQFSTSSTGSFVSESTVYVPVTAGSHTIEFLGTDTTGNSSFVDNVSINNVPEPATFGLLGASCLGLLACRRKA
jgi:hypothetical protein